jgi:predicted sulfurtransferase
VYPHLKMIRIANIATKNVFCSGLRKRSFLVNRKALFSSPRASAAEDISSTVDYLGRLQESILRSHNVPSSRLWTAVSFFRFFPPSQVLQLQQQGQQTNNAELGAIASVLKEALAALHIKGKILLSAEGFNANLVVPTPLLAQAYSALCASTSLSTRQPLLLHHSTPEGQEKLPIPGFFADSSAASSAARLLRGAEWNIGSTLDYGASHAHNQGNQGSDQSQGEDPTDHVEFPYKRLIVKPKPLALTDGFKLAAQPPLSSSGAPLDWSDAGPELEPQDWHAEIQESQEQGQSILLDCRNYYESEQGSFIGSQPLNTSTFAETWEKLEHILSSQNIPKDKRILTYCTGGIRCVKVNAYLKQKLGYTNIGRLKHGIVGYEQWLEREKQQRRVHADEKEAAHEHSKQQTEAPAGPEETSSLFLGENFLFDRRRIGAFPGDDLSRVPVATAVPATKQVNKRMAGR